MVQPTEIHRIFNQSLLSRRIMTQEVALQLYGRAVEICQTADEGFRAPYEVTMKGLADFIEDISTLLGEVGMSVSTAREETGSGRVWLALINTDAKDAGLDATDYTGLEISYIRAVIDNIITSYPVNSIGSTRALALTSGLKSTMLKSQAELILASTVSRGWLLKSKRGRYSLAPRSLMELESFLKEQYEDFIYTCHRCSKIVLTGLKCENGDCDAHVHESCMKVLRTHKGNKCPKCKSSFDELPPSHLGEKAASREADHFRSGPGKKRKRTSRAAEADEEDETDMEDEEGMRSQEQSQSQNPSMELPGSHSARAGPAWTMTSRSNSRRSVIPETQYEEEDELESDPLQTQRR